MTDIKWLYACRMLGKCLFEGMLLELPLAAFFLKKMRGGVCDINDMPSLDPEVYKHLLQLRHYQGDQVMTVSACIRLQLGDSRSSLALACFWWICWWIWWICDKRAACSASSCA